MMISIDCTVYTCPLRHFHQDMISIPVRDGVVGSRRDSPMTGFALISVLSGGRR